MCSNLNISKVCRNLQCQHFILETLNIVFCQQEQIRRTLLPKDSTGQNTLALSIRCSRFRADLRSAEEMETIRPYSLFTTEPLLLTCWHHHETLFPPIHTHEHTHTFSTRAPSVCSVFISVLVLLTFNQRDMSEMSGELSAICITWAKKS